jgi:hypothetical protein
VGRKKSTARAPRSLGLGRRAAPPAPLKIRRDKVGIAHHAACDYVAGMAFGSMHFGHHRRGLGPRLATDGMTAKSRPWEKAIVYRRGVEREKKIWGGEKGFLSFLFFSLSSFWKHLFLLGGQFWHHPLSRQRKKKKRTQVGRGQKGAGVIGMDWLRLFLSRVLIFFRFDLGPSCFGVCCWSITGGSIGIIIIIIIIITTTRRHDTT